MLIHEEVRDLFQAHIRIRKKAEYTVYDIEILFILQKSCSETAFYAMPTNIPSKK